MATKSLKAIAPVPTAADFLDIVLSKTQRKTPTASSNKWPTFHTSDGRHLGHPQKFQDQPNPQFLHEEGQIHTGGV